MAGVSARFAAFVNLFTRPSRSVSFTNVPETPYHADERLPRRFFRTPTLPAAVMHSNASTMQRPRNPSSRGSFVPRPAVDSPRTGV